MRKILKISAVTLAALSTFLISSCAGGSANGYIPPAGNLGPQPDPATRKAQIAAEPRGNFYYGRRYFVNKTRFWGYLRKPGKSWQSSKLVILNESSKRAPDRHPENGPAHARYAHDQNYEYRITGSYTGRKVYDPNSNSFLPEFRLTGYTLLDKEPGWIFSPQDYYDPKTITLRSR